MVWRRRESESKPDGGMPARGIAIKRDRAVVGQERDLAKPSFARRPSKQTTLTHLAELADPGRPAEMSLIIAPQGRTRGGWEGQLVTSGELTRCSALGVAGA